MPVGAIKKRSGDEPDSKQTHRKIVEKQRSQVAYSASGICKMFALGFNDTQ